MKVHPYFKQGAPLALVALLSLFSIARANNTLVNTTEEKSSGFTDGSTGPFSTCTTLAGNRGVVTQLNGQPCIKFEWHQAIYNGTRTGRGTEACSTLQIQKEGWFGFYIYLPSPGYPMNKNAGLAQWFANNSTCSSWTGMLDLNNNDLMISHRGNCGTATSAVVYPNFPRNRWVSIITHVVASHLKAGRFEIFVDGVSRYNATGINFGFDKWTADDALLSPNHIGLKIGQYDFDDGHYDSGEVRTSYYTNVTQMLGDRSGALDYIRYPIPGLTTLPAEAAEVGGGAVLEAVNANYHGQGYVNFPPSGGTLTFNHVNGGSGGLKTLEIRTALGVAARTGQLVVNGVATSISFPTTSAWSSWVARFVTVKLNPGPDNTIQFRSNGQDMPNIDEITLH